jgi:hypothetical protein
MFIYSHLGPCSASAGINQLSLTLKDQEKIELFEMLNFRPIDFEIFTFDSLSLRDFMGI